MADRFTYQASAPAVSSVAPNVGAAGTTVTLTGVGFTAASHVFFNGIDAVTFTVVSDTRITAVAPNGIAGTVADITVRTPIATSAITAADRFTYNNAPSQPGALQFEMSGVATAE